MRKYLLLCLLVPVLSYAQDQKLHLTLFGGVSNYQGDLQSRVFTFNQSNLGLGVGLKYDLTPHFGLRTNLNYGTIGAADRENEPSLRARNLSFESKLFEGNLLLEYTLFDLSEKRFSPYIFGGVGLFHFNPYAYDTLGNKIALKPLSTEGQGLAAYPDRKEYKLTQFTIPFGGGLKFRISDNVVLGYEIGLRKTFTDYLDDVSSTYVDPFALSQAKGNKAVEMAYRGGELKNGDPTYPADGSVRGGTKYKDWYYFQGLTLTIGIGSGGFGGGGNHRGDIGCPTRVY